MDLQQEYFLRHSITSPLVVYPDNHGLYSLILKNLPYQAVRQSRWMLLQINYSKQENHPPYYKFVLSFPSHDGGGAGGSSGTPFKPFWTKKVYWDEWESFVVDWAQHNRGELIPVFGQELQLALWEIFQYAYDSWLANNLIDRLKDNLYVGADESIPYHDRLAALQEVEGFIRGKNRSVATSFASVRGYGDETRFYADWLAKLL